MTAASAASRTAAPPSAIYDHITPFRDGGPTSFVNGRGVCERHNYTREMPGWSVELLADHPHTVITITPTGHSYLSQPRTRPDASLERAHWGRSRTAEVVSFPVKLPVQP